MMKKDCKYLMELYHIHMVQVLENRATKLSKYKMINFDDYTNENKTKHNLK